MRTRTPAALAIVGALALAACGSDDDSTDTTPPATEATADDDMSDDDMSDDDMADDMSDEEMAAAEGDVVAVAASRDDLVAAGLAEAEGPHEEAGSPFEAAAGLVAEYAGSAYNSSKSGLLGLMRSVAQDAGQFGVTANAVLPGWVRTAMAERSARYEAIDRGITPDGVWAERAALYPPGRVATPEEVAALIAFLASEESSGVSGEAIRVALGSMA